MGFDLTVDVGCTGGGRGATWAVLWQKECQVSPQAPGEEPGVLRSFEYGCDGHHQGRLKVTGYLTTDCTGEAHVLTYGNDECVWFEGNPFWISFSWDAEVTKLCGVPEMPPPGTMPLTAITNCDHDISKQEVVVAPIRPVGYCQVDPFRRASTWITVACDEDLRTLSVWSYGNDRCQKLVNGGSLPIPSNFEDGKCVSFALGADMKVAVQRFDYDA